MTYGERIREVRKEKGLSQIELARRLGWVQSQISERETGETPTKTEDIELICKALGVGLLEFHAPLEDKAALISNKGQPKEDVLNKAKKTVQELQKLIDNLKE